MNEPSASDRIALLEKELAEMRALITEVARKQAWPQYVKKRKLAELLQVSERTIDDWVSEDRIPYHKVGTGTRFLISEIVQWTAGQWSARRQDAAAKPKSRPARK